MRQLLIIALIVIAITSLITVSFTFNQVINEGDRLENDIRDRSSFLADGLKDSIEPNFVKKSDKEFQVVVKKFTDDQRVAGIAIINNTGKIRAASLNLATQAKELQKIGTDAMDGDKADGKFLKSDNEKIYAFAYPLHEKKSVVGSLVIVQRADYIDTRLSDIWKDNLLRLVVQAFIISLTVVLILKWIIFEPIRNLVLFLQSARMGDSSKSFHKVINNPIFGHLLKEVGAIQQDLVAARISASEEARLRLEQLDSPWTAERLSMFVQNMLKDRTIFVVSNREPYVHTKNGNKIESHVPASGMVTAIESIMAATGGMWIAQGSGDADRLVVDKDDKIRVPQNDPKYTLKRIWLTDEERKGFYDGFSNEGIWPLCHMAHTRPVFRKSDWVQYKKVNEKFAKSVLKEIKDHENPIVLIQDFHFSLLPRLIKDKRPDATIGVFWHIPWPNAEAFSICPWKKEILDGILGADVLGFHTQLHCNNFINTVGKELEAMIDLEEFSITKNNHNTLVKAFPISIAFSKTENVKTKTKSEDDKKILATLGVQTPYVGIGVDRLDYTKGILERLKAVELFLTNYPTYIEEFTFVQISAPSRTSIKHYQDFEENVQKEVDRINNRFKRNKWKPIVFLKEYHSHKDIYPLYKAADLCLVTSLHDGMNLVAKEFVSARDDERGVLILSQYAGAARELRGALIVNPYNGEQTAEAIHAALRMKKSEQTKRMKRMREIVVGYNIYRWSAEFLRTMVDLG